MKEIKQPIYTALVDGATRGLQSRELYDFIVTKCPQATSKRIVKASLLALSDPDLRNRNILTVIYALAIDHRLDDVEYARRVNYKPDFSKVATLPLPEKKKTRKKA